MGLDISLYKAKDLEKSLKLEAEYQKKSDEIWEKVADGKKYEELTEEQTQDARAKTDKLAKDMGLGRFGSDKNIKNIEKPSKIHKDHLFKIGYFRSSYNSSGLNRVVKDAIGEDLYSIFEPNDSDYYIKPDWEASLKRAKAVREKFKKHIAENPYRVARFSEPLKFDSGKDLPDNEKEALDIFLKTRESHKANEASSTWFSNSSGHYFLGKNHLKVRGIITGKDTMFAKTEEEASDAFYVIYEADKADLQWYAEALDVVVETVEFVLAQSDKNDYCLGWSG